MVKLRHWKQQKQLEGFQMQTTIFSHEQVHVTHHNEFGHITFDVELDELYTQEKPYKMHL